MLGYVETNFPLLCIHRASVAYILHQVKAKIFIRPFAQGTDSYKTLCFGLAKRSAPSPILGRAQGGKRFGDFFSFSFDDVYQLFRSSIIHDLFLIRIDGF
jgi:hypothetical protein